MKSNRQESMKLIIPTWPAGAINEINSNEMFATATVAARAER